MAARKPLSAESFVRDLTYTMRTTLSDMLDPVNMWEDLAAAIPLDLNYIFFKGRIPFQARYVTYNFASFRRKPQPTMALLEDWEMENCQLKHLIKVLFDVSLIEAAHYLVRECEQSQQEAGATHDSLNGDGVKEDIQSMQSGKSDASLKGVPPPDSGVGLDGLKIQDEDMPRMEEINKMPEIRFQILEQITESFDHRKIEQGGRLLGSGGFGDVFLGEYLLKNGTGQTHRVAVKRLKSDDKESLKQFDHEFKTLCTYKHKHLVTLLGYSMDGFRPCLVYEYIVNGDLENRLACFNGSPPLSVPLRLEIARDTAEGIAYLHKKDVTHRDIKTANILLDAEFKAKVGDFATARTLPKKAGNKKTQMMAATTIIGSTPYLAPEAFQFVIHRGLDVYSFGVCLLELLTGLPVLDDKRDNENLKVHIQEYCAPPDDDDDDDDEDDEGNDNNGKDGGTIFDLVDKKPGVVWKGALVEDLHTLAMQCLEHMDSRKKINFVLEQLNKMIDNNRL